MRMESCKSSEAAGLELLVSQLQGRPGVEHGCPEFAPHPVIGQAEDLGGKLSGSFGGKDRGTAEAWRGGRRHSRDGGYATDVDKA